MRFRFCGDGDCPDWVLAVIHSTLSELSAVKLKIVTQMMVKSVLGELIPDEKLKEAFGGGNTADFQPVKLAFACLRFLVLNAIRHNADEHTFSTELQQLGLQKDHTTAICRVTTENTQALRNHLKATSLSVNELDAVTYSIGKDTIDCALVSIDIANEIVDGIPTKTTHKVNVPKFDIPILLNELKLVKQLMDDLDYEQRHNAGETVSKVI